MQEIINSPKMPEDDISHNCKKPYPCPVEHCWNFQEDGSVFELYRGGDKCFKMYENGIFQIEDIPEDEYKLTTNQQVQLKCAKENIVHVEKDKIKEFLHSFEYPLYYLDFETYNTAIPLFDGIKPYQQVPFQFSLHVKETPEAELKHYEFLAEGTDDPREKFIIEMKKLLGDHGAIVTYNMSFEKRILRELGELFPEHKDWIDSVIGRVVDLLVPFQKFYYYNPKQKGSASIKKVLPALIGKSYDGMEIAEGGTASLQYLFSTHGRVNGDKANEEETKKIREALLKYCELDTLAMVWILEKLEEICLE